MLLCVCVTVIAFLCIKKILKSKLGLSGLAQLRYDFKFSKPVETYSASQ